MNKIHLFFLLCFSSFSLTAQIIYSGNLTITTQQQIDDFFDNNFTIIDGSLIIQGNNISSLSGLINLEEIKTSLIIQNTPYLSSLEGLDNLKIIGPGFVGGSNYGGHLWIYDTGLTSILGLNSLHTIWTDIRFIDNPYLENLNALQNVSFVGRFLWIENNNSLIDIEGLSNITSIGDDTRIQDNSSLTSIFGLRNVSSIGGLVSIYNNDELINLNGLGNITSLESSFYIYNNESLNDLSSLLNLTSIGNVLGIQGNNSLLSLNGLTNLLNVNYLDIVGNQSLINFCSLSNLFSEGSVTFSTTIEDNFFNPDENNIVNGNCTFNVDNTSITIISPKQDDLYVSGYPIGIALNSEQIHPSSILKFYYKKVEDEDWSYLESGDNASNYLSSVDGEFHYYFNAPEVSSLEYMQIKVTVELNSDIKEEISTLFQVQPVNYHSDLGFLESGTSIIPSPLDYYTETLWSEHFGSPGHFCADANAQDWMLNFHDTCFKNLYAPFDGIILKIRDDNYSELCGLSNDGTGGKQVIIQSSENKSYAMTFAHLSYIHVEENEEILKGEFIGRIGGTGTNLAHAHFSLHKNIYSWFPFYNTSDESYTIYQMIDLLMVPATFYDTTEVQVCDYAENNFSADFNFNFNSEETINRNNILINNLTELNAFTDYNYEGSTDTIQIEYESDGIDNIYNESTINIVSLSNLSSLKSIDGSLILRNLNITNLTGLENLLYISGDLIIENNSSLSDYCGIYNLLDSKGLQGSLIVTNNNLNPTEESILNDYNCPEVLSSSDLDTVNNILIYPNPTTEDLYFNTTNSNNLKIEIFSLKGELLGRFNNPSHISLQNFENGLYLIKATRNNIKSYFKILKN